MLLVDACRNDALASGGRNSDKFESVTRPQKIAPPGGVAAFFSCTAGQKAYENDELKHGVFFHYVIKGLQGEANGGKRPEVTLSELVAYVEREVPDFVRVKHEGKGGAGSTSLVRRPTGGAVASLDESFVRIAE